MKAIFITGATALLLSSVSAVAQTQPPAGDAAMPPPVSAPATDAPPPPVSAPATDAPLPPPPPAPPAPEASMPSPDAALPASPPAEPLPAPDAAPPPAVAPTPAPEAKTDYPTCSKTVQDSCVNPSEAGVTRKKPSHRRHH